MLQAFLKAIQDGGVQSLQDIADVLQVPVAMVRQMAEDLVRRGYLQEMGADCSTPESGCMDCPLAGGCHSPTRHWFLTGKGKEVLSVDRSENEH